MTRAAYSPGPAEIHSCPLEDGREHVESPDCWCRPERDEVAPNLWIHRDHDERAAAGIEEPLA